VKEGIIETALKLFKSVFASNNGIMRCALAHLLEELFVNEKTDQNLSIVDLFEALDGV
jgi:hypothetical protein